MFEGKVGLQSQFLEFSLNRISEILQEPKTSKRPSLTRSKTFSRASPPIDFSSIEQICSVGPAQEDPNQILKGTSEDMQRYAKSLEELACYKNGKSTDYIWLEDSLYHLEQVMVNIYSLLQALVQHLRISDGCCFDEVCEQKHSYTEFQKDLFCFVYINLNKAKEAIKEILKKNPTELDFIRGTIQIEENGALGKELRLKIEQNCIEQNKNKRKRKKKNKLPKNEEKILQNVEKIERVVEEDEKNLTSFLNNLVIEEKQRERCSVSEEWLKRFSYSNFLKK